MRFVIILICFFSTSFSQQTEDLHEITVHVSNIKSKEGKLIVAVFDSDKNYMQKECMKKIIPIHHETDKKFTIALPKGTYAIGIFHDLNDNGELDKNFIGIPKEAFGFSNKSLGLFGPPSFKETKFLVSKTKVEVNVDLKQL